MESELIKKEVLNILKAFDLYCRKNDIKYVLAYGTLIGAIRHKGFIPWDDDIDVVIPVGDYNRLKAITASDPFIDENIRYRISFPGDENYCYSFPKVIDTKYVVREKNISDRYNIGLFIDIFKADYWPENRIKETYQLKKGQLLRRMNEICLRGNLEGKRYEILDKLLRPVDLIFRCFGVTSEKICVRMESIGRNNIPSEYMGVLEEGTGWKKEKMESRIYTETVLVPFEDGMFPAPADYDIYLRAMYGDYMTLPPQEQRVGHEYDIVSVRQDI